MNSTKIVTENTNNKSISCDCMYVTEKIFIYEMLRLETKEVNLYSKSKI